LAFHNFGAHWRVPLVTTNVGQSEKVLWQVCSTALRLFHYDVRPLVWPSQSSSSAALRTSLSVAPFTFLLSPFVY